MAVRRTEIMRFGGFDERFTTVAEDNDLCYRWLAEGRRIVYDPALVVWHHDWRTPAQMREQYRRYARWQAAFYAKHLRRGDPRVLRFVGRDLRWAAGGVVRPRRRRRGGWPDPRRAVPGGLLSGLRDGWRAFAADDAPGLSRTSARIREDRRRPGPRGGTTCTCAPCGTTSRRRSAVSPVRRRPSSTSSAARDRTRTCCRATRW